MWKRHNLAGKILLAWIAVLMDILIALFSLTEKKEYRD